MTERKKGKQGFASMDKEKQRAIARKGGSATPYNFKNDPERASILGARGGKKSKRRA